MNKPEKGRCWFRGRRGTLVLLLSSLSLALYSASVPGQGVQGGWEVTGDRHSSPWGEEGADTGQMSRDTIGRQREKTRENISWAATDEPRVAWGLSELRPCLELLSPSPKLPGSRHH